MKKQNYKIGQKVILNCKNFVAKNNLDNKGWFPVTGTITGFTNKRIKAINDYRHSEGFYKIENVMEIS